MAGEPIVAKLTRAPGNNAPIGGLKVVAKSGWFAARPSGTENIYKIYAESFQDQAHLDAIVAEAQQIVTDALSAECKLSPTLANSQAVHSMSPSVYPMTKTMTCNLEFKHEHYTIA